MYGCKDASEQVTADRDFGQLERDGPSMTHHPRTDFDEPGLQAGK